ncbi:hypothetical protein [Azonexus sp. IMCC34839]|uniref:hypothetical protein n=1 Tax=Azonexus sp. IMCC34839 TaxID=3133695 RepID=UPI00399B169E
MSVRTLSKALNSSGTTGAARLALIALSDWSDDNGHVLASLRNIAEKCRISENQARCAISALTRDRFISTEDAAPGDSEMYRINLAKLGEV